MWTALNKFEYQSLTLDCRLKWICVDALGFFFGKGVCFWCWLVGKGLSSSRETCCFVKVGAEPRTQSLANLDKVAFDQEKVGGYEQEKDTVKPYNICAELWKVAVSPDKLIFAFLSFFFLFFEARLFQLDGEFSQL